MCFDCSVSLVQVAVERATVRSEVREQKDMDGVDGIMWVIVVAMEAVVEGSGVGRRVAVDAVVEDCGDGSGEKCLVVRDVEEIGWEVIEEAFVVSAAAAVVVVWGWVERKEAS